MKSKLTESQHSDICKPINLLNKKLVCYSLTIKEITVSKTAFYYPERKFSERHNHKKVHSVELVVRLLIRFHIYLVCFAYFAYSQVLPRIISAISKGIYASLPHLA